MVHVRPFFEWRLEGATHFSFWLKSHKRSYALFRPLSSCAEMWITWSSSAMVTCARSRAPRPANALLVPLSYISVDPPIYIIKYSFFHDGFILIAPHIYPQLCRRFAYSTAYYFFLIKQAAQASCAPQPTAHSSCCRTLADNKR